MTTTATQIAAAEFAAEQIARREARKARKLAPIIKARAFAEETGLAEKLAAAPIVIRSL
jgi:hypothetical protein